MDREEVIRNLRACLLTAKGGLRLDNLSQDYKTLIGESIPFKKLGHPSLVSFLESVPGLRAQHKGDQCFVEALPTKESAHISKFVGQQKASKKPRNKRTKAPYPASPRKPASVSTQRIVQQINSNKGGNAIYQQQSSSRSAQSTMRENKAPGNGFKLPTLPTPPQLLSPLSPAKSLGARVPLPPPQQLPKPVPLIVNNGPKLRKAVPKPIPQVRDPRLELKARAKSLNLPEPIYEILPTKLKNKELSIFAQVKIGSHGYRSYPKEARSPEEAEKFAAEVALSDLTEKYGVPTNITETTDKNLIIKRVLAIVDSYSNGVFMHQVPVLYKQQYREVLSPDWETVVENCSSISQENGADNSIILRRFVQPASPKTNNVPGKPGLRSPDKGKLKTPVNAITPEPLELPDGDIWMVLVSHVESADEVWVRLVDDAYSEKFGAMISEMWQHYSSPQMPAKAPPIQVDNYYALFDDNSWHRVRCIDHNSETGVVTVSFIDFGDEESFNYSELKALDPKFCQLPAQAFRLSLWGLEDFNECEQIATEIEKRLLDQAFYVEVKSRGKVTDNEPCASVIFYDTRGPEDINLNNLLSKQILEYIAKVPKLDTDRQVSEVFVSHVEKNGDIYVQIQSESMRYLIKVLNRIIETRIKTKDFTHSSIANTNMTKVYFVCVDGNWYRGKIASCTVDNQYNMFLIDFGKTVTVRTENMIPLDQLSDVLPHYPPQALKIHLSNIEKSMIDDKMIARLKELAPESEPLLAKVVKSSPSQVPSVELLKRIQPSNMLVSINNTLVYEEELFRSQGDGNNNIKPRKRVERLNSKSSVNEDDDITRTLKPPKISPIGQFFDVHVTMACHPGNFTVQPYGDGSALQTMMKKLQEVCRAYKGPPPTPSSVKQGKFYAAEHIDRHWYRVCISGIIRENMVSVYFCDFGDISVLPLSKLQPLKSEFYELPYQAIKAKLVGIRPVNIDWSVEDCLRFQSFVLEKNFVSLVVESKPDGISPADTVLGLKLINVDTDEDIMIDQLLVNEGRAVFDET